MRSKSHQFSNLVSSNLFYSDIQNFCDIVDNFLKMFYALIEFHKNSKVKGSLIAEEGESDNIIAKTYKDINLSSFYAQNIGFHVSWNFFQYLHLRQLLFKFNLFDLF